MFLGLRSIIYPVADLDAARAWYRHILGIDPYFDEGPYVGFAVGGYELGLFAGGEPAVGPTTYWGVADVDRALAHLLDAGATVIEPIADVGGGIRVAGVRDPQGFPFGIIENPHFEVQAVAGVDAGPGR